jgi:hypothetical protein
MQIKKTIRGMLSCIKQACGRYLYVFLFRIHSLGKRRNKKSTVIINMRTKGRHIPFLARIAGYLKADEVVIIRKSCLALFQTLYRQRTKTAKIIRVSSLLPTHRIYRGRDFMLLKEPGNRQKLFLFSYDYFTVHDPKSDIPYRFLPFYMSQRFYEDGEDLFPPVRDLYAGQRRITLGFAGAVNRQGYAKKKIFPIIDRYRIIEYVKKQFAGKLLVSDRRTDDPGHDGSDTPFIFITTAKTGTDPRKYPLTAGQYIRFLGECNFFLALPGVSIPQAHNLVEAMRMGTIPVFNYNEYFHPALKHGFNCLTFDSEDSLKRLLQRILRITQKKIIIMRKNVLNTYTSLLSPQALAESLEEQNSPDLEILYICSSIQIVRRNRAGTL